MFTFGVNVSSIFLQDRLKMHGSVQCHVLLNRKLQLVGTKCVKGACIFYMCRSHHIPRHCVGTCSALNLRI